MKGIKILLSSPQPIAEVYKSHKPNINKRMRRTSFQARLGRKLDNINKKAIDNSIRLSSHPTDMIRIKADRDPRSGDLISRTITDVEILPIILPIMKDIPMRRFLREGSEVLIPSLYPIQNEEYFTIYAPVEVKLDEDDLLIRLIYVDGTEEPYCLVLQVKEILSTIGYNSLIWNKINVTLYDEKLPNHVVNMIREAHEKRYELNW